MKTIPVLKPGEGLIFIFEKNRPVDEVVDNYKEIQATYPGHPVIGIPSDCDIKVEDIDSMIEYLESFKKEVLKNNLKEKEV